MATGLFNLKQVNQAISQGAWSGYIAPRWVEYLVVAGGGAGGADDGGGGGAGGLLTGIVTVAAGTSYTVTVGAGGTAGSFPSAGGDGVASVFGSISSTGGGGGGFRSDTLFSGRTGGSGGGSSNIASGERINSGGIAVAGQGNYGGRNTLSSAYGSGGGGGAGTVGINATSTTGGSGGAGIASAITGTVVAYSGGGGGSTRSGTVGSGGVGGGGTSGVGTSNNGTAGAANTGGGGGGGAFNSSLGGAGGSGIVVVRYPGNVQFYTGGTVNYNNGYIIHIFTSNGTLAPTTPAPYNTSYQISRSLRFNSADSAYLDRAQTTGSTQKATWSGWVKRSALTIGAYSTLFNAGTANTDSLVWNNTGDTLRFWLNGASSADLVTTQQFRDPSAWYHIVIAIDTTQSTAANRILMYVNGVQVTAFTTATYPTQNYTFTKLNTSGQSAYLGGIGASLFFSGYMTEVNFVDGQQLAATSFGATSTTTGVWAPIQYTGTYGTNGFYLNFSDNSNTTAATLGKDYSGNGNNWTPNNFSVTAGAGNDSMVDSPTQYGFDTGVGGSVRGNYATLNPIGNPSTPTYSITNGNLDYAATGSVGVAYQQAAIATIGVTSGKWYYEGTVTSNNPGLGFSSELFYQSARGTIRITYYSGSLGNSAGITATGSPATFTNGDVIAVAYDADAGTATVYKNNVSQGTFSGIAIGTALFPYVEPNTAAAASGVSFNFGQRPFAYTAPSGFKALCTQNLPTPTIGATSNTLATQFFAPVLWTGTGTQTRSITGLDFQPDLTWMKIRADTPQDHQLYDAVRGAGGGKNLSSNTNAAEGTVNGYPDADYGYVSSFDSGGFSVNDGAVATTGGYVNYSGRTYVAWNWRAGNNAGASNSAGSITSTVSANTTSGFSVVTYTGTGSAGATVGHGLGAVPSMIIFKRRNATSDWQVYHTSLGNANSVYLNLTNSSAASPGMLNSTTPTSTLITLGTSTDTNPSTGTMVAYCFAEVAGYSKFGSYTGNGSADGPFVFTGFRPAYVMVKRTSSAGTNWQILDTKRSTYNVMADYLYASAANVEGYDTSVGIDSLSNGFKIRGTDANTNTNSATYIYMAFAENPFKYSLAR